MEKKPIDDGGIHINSRKVFTFIDLFAGIGGFRLAMQELGGKCVFTSEIDAHAQATYEHNFKDKPHGDITDPSVQAHIPAKFDILCAGFPCQPFSISGLQKGFEDRRGNLFWHIRDILDKHKPKGFILENVSNLEKHDKGNTFRVIMNCLQIELGYRCFHRVLDTLDYANIPQHRERIFIVGVDSDTQREYIWPGKKPLTAGLPDILESNPAEKYFYREGCKVWDRVKGYDDPSMFYRVWEGRKSPICQTLLASMGTGGNNIPIVCANGGVRKLTPRECLRLQGFPDWFEFPPKMPETQKYKQIGNSVTVPVVRCAVEHLAMLVHRHTEEIA